jgi:hypothetical protein
MTSNIQWRFLEASRELARDAQHYMIIQGVVAGTVRNQGDLWEVIVQSPMCKLPTECHTVPASFEMAKEVAEMRAQRLGWSFNNEDKEPALLY